MLSTGQVLKTEQGRRINVTGVIAAGGQGTAYAGSIKKSGERVVVKEYHPQFNSVDTDRRLTHLLLENLHALSPLLGAPTDRFSIDGSIGHVAPLAPGGSLEALLVRPSYSFIDGLALAAQIARAFAVLHDRGLVHGDPQSNNVLVDVEGGVHRAVLIDFDNFADTRCPQLPRPPCWGHNLYMAPELRSAAMGGHPAVPAIASDVFGLAVMIHEIILLKHVATGADESADAFVEAMTSGAWPLDPARARRPADDAIGGYPVEVLDADVGRLLRHSLAVSPDDRPSAADWVKALAAAVECVFACPRCGGEVVIDSSKTVCPYPACGKPYPSLVLQVPGGQIGLAGGKVVLGRRDLGGGTAVSGRHATISRIGPEFWIEDMSTNGTWRWANNGWARFPQGSPRLIQAGDRLRFADVEAMVVEEA